MCIFCHENSTPTLYTWKKIQTGYITNLCSNNLVHTPCNKKYINRDTQAFVGSKLKDFFLFFSAQSLKPVALKIC